MKQYQIYIGLNDKDTRTQIVKTETALSYIENLVCDYTDGGTISTANGVYKHENGKKIIENTIIVIINDYNDTRKNAVTAIINDAKKTLNQERILLTALELSVCDLI